MPVRVGKTMDQQTLQALNSGGIADITTTGRKTGLPRRIEIFFHHFDGSYYLTGRPGPKRDWEANISSNPNFVLHLKRGLEVDVPVAGEIVAESGERRAILLRALVDSFDTEPAKAERAVDRWVEESPLVRFAPIV